MGRVIDLFDLGGRQVGVDLGRGKRLMAQEFLNTAQVGAIVQHMGGKAVAEGMGTDSRVQAGDAEVFIHLATHASGAESAAMLVDKQNLAIEVGVALRPLVPELHIVLNGLQGGGTDG